MIQYYLDLEKQVKNISQVRLSGGQIQKITSTAYYLSLAVRVPGKTWHLYLGRGSGQEGVWLHHAPPPAPLRRKDNFLEYLRRHLSSCALVDLQLDRSDRIVRLDYQKYGQLQSFLLFWKARKLYFAHHYQEAPEAPHRLLLSWHGKAVLAGPDVTDLFEYFNEVGRKEDMLHDLQSPHQRDMAELLEEELKAANLKGTVTSPSFLQRKRLNIQEDLRKAQQWERLQGVLDRGDNLEVYELKVDDQKIKFSGDLNPYERRNLLFQKIKKLKRGEGILKERLKGVEEQLDGKELTAVATSGLPLSKPVWGKDEKNDPAPVTRSAQDEFRVFKYDFGQIAVGLSSQGNDQLRNKWAGKEDWWLHLDGAKSAHVVVKLPDAGGLPPGHLNLAASILAQFSHFTADWIPVIYTQVKNLKGVTGAPGMVIYKKEKHLRCPKMDLGPGFKE